MSKISENIEAFTIDLLHINDVISNKLIDLYAGDAGKTFFISHPTRENLSKYVLEVIANRIGKIGNTVLLKSAIAGESEQIIGKDINDLAWQDANGVADATSLHRYIDNVYRELDLKGNNPLFFSVGAIKWKVAYKDNLIKEVTSPLLLFPIKLIRSASRATPIYVEFINDDIYINPCFIASLRKSAGDKIADEFPHPNAVGQDVDFPIDLYKLGDGEGYFDSVTAYVNSQCRTDISGETTFEFDKNVVAIAQYNHDELCMYYDIKRNKEKIYSHPLVNRIFNKCEPYQEIDYSKTMPQFIMPRDSVQERIIKRVVAGQSLVVKGPPGTGKTVTITNLIASLLAQNKKVLLSSQKTAAMGEVYAKLPESIRKFVMLLDSETEAQASKLNVVDVKMEFNQLLNDKKAYRFNSDKYEEFESGNRDVSQAVSTISAYRKIMFGEKGVAGKTYYSALDTICNFDIDPVLFMDGKDAYHLTFEEYSNSAKNVEEAGEWFDKATVNHAFIQSPWYPINADFTGVDLEKAVAKNKEISLAVSSLITECEQALNEDKWYNNVSVYALENLLSGPLNKNALDHVIKGEHEQITKALRIAYEEYAKTQTPSVEIPYPSVQAIEKYLKPLGESRIDGSMTKGEFLNFYKQSNVIEILKGAGEIDVVKTAVDGISNVLIKQKDTLDEFYSIFSSDVSEENLALIESAFEKFSVYEEKKSYAKPKLLDFKTKKLYLELKGLGYGKELSFEQVVKGVCLYSKAQAFNQTLEDIKVRLSSHFKIKFTKEQITTLFAFVKASNDAGVEESSYVKEFIACKETIYNAINECGCDLDYSLSDLLKTFIKADVLQRLKKDVKFFVEVSGFCFDGDDEVELAKAIYLAGEIVKCGAIGQNVEEIIEKATAIYTAGKSISPALIKVKNLLLDFANTCYKNYYTIKYDKCTVGELSVIIKEGQDRSLLSAVCEYLKIIKADNGVCSLERFFRPFETGIRQREGYSFKEIFELSVNFLAVEYKKATMGGLRNGLGDKISHEFDNWKNAYSQIDRATLSIIESQCMAKIDCNDQDFNFLKAEKQSGVTLRRFFKDYAKAILKLKKCFILSPSTASVFFTKDDYADFDIVIVDEASQLEPTAILPILFRAKQVVLVGDEWQMPPIKHFSARTEKRIYDSDGEVKILSPNTSVLGLALDNCAFPVEQLACHYRSKTESLITFSQERFYPNMKTFPARVPKADGLGFKDVYVQDGRCEGGVNELEAAQVVEELRLHFDKYYDEKECSLGGHSIGVVAFGKEQKDEIESLVAKDKELSKKIQKAIDKFDDLPEKLIFFKTIETVQGQEAEHLILSLTYGRGKTGKIVQSFGELNRGFNEDKLGQCIFNVAVTRAKSSVTVIHSVLAEEITLESVAFIGKYLSIVDRFGKENKDQWVGKSIDEASGYIKQIANFIVENGVSADRVVIDYGVNETSVKIPIAILSEDMTQAELGLWCEKPLAVNTNYFDYNVRYVESLKDRGWIIHKTFIHDWVDNNQSEKESLAKAIKKYVKITNKEVQNG